MNARGGHGLPFFDPQIITRIHRLLLGWYRRNARVLPWRNRDDVYAVLVSEFMLQQTQASRVCERLPAWIEQFPDIRALAAAGRRSVLLAWTGMGYNRRALALHETAKAIVEQHGGIIPADTAVLQSLPGVGAYTAHAVACFGHRRRTAMVDVNIRRIFSRLLFEQTDDASMISDSLAWEAASLMLPKRSYYDWNQALMDLGAMICTAREPVCETCPLKGSCRSAGRMTAQPRVRSSAVRETPRRIYRGRVVELLRQAEAHELRASVLLAALYPADSADRERFADMLATLLSDGLVTLHPDNPATDPKRLTVRLAE